MQKVLIIILLFSTLALAQHVGDGGVPGYIKLGIKLPSFDDSFRRYEGGGNACFPTLRKRQEIIDLMNKMHHGDKKVESAKKAYQSLDDVYKEIDHLAHISVVKLLTQFQDLSSPIMIKDYCGTFEKLVLKGVTPTTVTQDRLYMDQLIVLLYELKEFDKRTRQYETCKEIQVDDVSSYIHILENFLLNEAYAK